MTTRAPTTGPAARGDVLPIFDWVAEAPKGRASSASAGFGGGGRGGAWPARPWAQPLESHTKDSSIECSVTARETWLYLEDHRAWQVLDTSTSIGF